MGLGGRWLSPQPRRQKYHVDSSLLVPSSWLGMEPWGWQPQCLPDPPTLCCLWWHVLTSVLPQVQDTVHGVTTEECQAALQNHGWNVQRAIQYLKVQRAAAPAASRVGTIPDTPALMSCVPLQVEQLFCLGLKSRVECHRVLEMFDWNLAQASSHLLDPYSSSRQK